MYILLEKFLEYNSKKRFFWNNDFTVYLISIILLDVCESCISITRNASPLIFSRSFVDFSPRGDVTLYQTLFPLSLPPLTRDLRSLDFPLLRGIRFLLVSLMWHLNDRSLGFRWHRNANRPAIAEIGLSSITYSDYYSHVVRRSIIFSEAWILLEKFQPLAFNGNFLLKNIIFCKNFMQRKINEFFQIFKKIETRLHFSTRYQVDYSIK